MCCPAVSHREERTYRLMHQRSRKFIVHGLALGLVLAASTAMAADSPRDATMFKVLDSVGTLHGGAYDPRPVINAINRLQPLGKARGVALLRRYIASRQQAGVRTDSTGLFAVIRVLLVPPASKKKSADACTPRQRKIADGGCWRPPLLGAPYPAAPEDLLSLRYPIFVLGDVPLSVVSGYAIGGHPEHLIDHLGALAALGGWLGGPLKPKPSGEIRYLFIHYGQWSLTSVVGQMVEAQLKRL